MSKAPSHRRLETPGRSETRSPARSGSRRHAFDPDVELRLERLKMLEDEVRRERERLRVESESLRREGPRRSTSAAVVNQTAELSVERRVDEYRRSASTAVPRRKPEPRAERGMESPRRSASTVGRCRDVERRAERHTERQRDSRVQRSARSRSPSFSKKDLIDIIQSFRDGLTLPPVDRSTPQQQQTLNHKNILPEFNPSNKSQRMDVWLRKVNECASVYGWDERTTIHFAMQKLQGLAKTWYEGLNTILFTWSEWQEKLLRAFPCEQNHGQALENMIERKSSENESIEVYYYEKLSLVNQCEITGSRAAECIIHGITDKTLKSGALALRCTHPDQLLQYLLSNSNYNQQGSEKLSAGNKKTLDTQNSKSISERKHLNSCYNCKEKGHGFLHCPKPLVKCTNCNKIGHTSEKCFTKRDDSTH